MGNTVRAARATTDDVHNYLLTWKPDKWPHSELRKLVDNFQSFGFVEDWWRCIAHRQVRAGDRAYMLKQGRPIGIFGIGQIVGLPRRFKRAHAGENPWSVSVRFDASHGDVLWDPLERLLVSEDQLADIPVPKKRWQTQASGVRLEPQAARTIDELAFDPLRVTGGIDTSDDEVREVLRRARLLQQQMRPEQQAFRSEIRRIYGDRCAVTGCSTPATLEAAHVSTRRGLDDNSPTNGILLRSDIHVLFDRLLITLAGDGTKLEVSPELNDPSYGFLRGAVVTRPATKAPSEQNIQAHRDLFAARAKRSSAASAS